MSSAGRIVKRAMDIGVAALGLAAAAPVLLVVAGCVRARMGSPVLLGQVRAGIGGRPFRVWKFRTMTDDRDADGNLLPDEVRLTPLGRRLRKWSLDELPQLANVLTGSMSLVGPRPLLVRYLDRYDARQRRRLLVRPGITGLAQVSGRNAVRWEDRLELDVRYVEEWTLWLDVVILACTVQALVDTRHVQPEVEEFWGVSGPPPSGPRALPVEADETARPRSPGRRTT